MKTKARKVGLLLLSLFLAVTAVACPVPAGEFVGLTSAELVERIIDALQAVETVRLQALASYVEVHMDKMTGEIVREIVVASSRTRIYDMVNNRMREIDKTTGWWARKGIVSDTIVSDTESVRLRYYVDGFYYLGMNGRWIKQEAPWQVLSIDTMIRLLNASKVEALPTERVRGINCFVLSLQPDVELYWQEKAARLEELGFDLEAKEVVSVREGLEALFRDMTLKLWVAKDTFLPVKHYTESSISDVYEGFEFTKISQDTIYYQFNQPVTIELPPEAADAAMFEPHHPAIPRE